MKVDVGGGIIDHRGHPWMYNRWAYTKKSEAEAQVAKQIRQDRENHRPASRHAIVRKPIIAGERQGQHVYAVLGRGIERRFVD